MKRRSILVLAMLLVCFGIHSARADFTLYDNEQLTVNSYHDKGTLYDTSQVSIISGGYVVDLDAYNSSSVDISAGFVRYLDFYDSSVVDISGGYLRYPTAHNSSLVDMSGGAASIFYSFDFSTVNISGGSVNSYGASNYSHVNILGGSMDGLYASSSSIVDISGGSMNYLYSREFSTITFYGQNFLASGGLVLDGQRVLGGAGTLAGEWFDGTPWSVDILMHVDTATIQVVPVPSAVVLGSIGLGFAGWRLRKRREL